LGQYQMSERVSRTLPVRALLETGFVVLLVCLALGPILAIAVMSFDTSGIAEPFRAGGDNWMALLSDGRNLKALFYSFALMIRVPIGMVIALIAVWLIVRVEVPGGRAFEYLFWFAYFLPALPMLTGWILLLDANYGLLNRLALATGVFQTAPFNIYSAGGILWVHLSSQTVPIMVILIAPAMRMVDRAMDDAAILAGAGAGRILLRVIVPLLVPVLFVAGTASGIRALGSFETEQILGVPVDIFVYSNRIYHLVNLSPSRINEAMAMSFVLVLILLAMSLFYHRILRLRNTPTSEPGGERGQRSAYSARVKWLGSLSLALFVVVSVALPFAMLIVGSFMRLYGFFDLAEPWTDAHWRRVLWSNEFKRSMMSTVVLGLACALPGALLFALIAWVLSGLKGWRQTLTSVLVWLPWALPGIILGAGLLEMTLSFPGMTALHGTIYPLIYALLLRELPLGVHMFRASFGQTNRELAEAARLTGARTLRIFWKIILPLNLPAFVVVFLLIFALVVTDIGTLVLISPPGIQTLSVLAFKFTSMGEFESASVISTIVALMSFFVSLLAYQLARRIGGWR